MARYENNRITVNSKLSYSFSVRLSTAGGSARNYALPLDVHFLVWKRNTRAIKLDTSPSGLSEIAWSSGKDAFRIIISY